MASATNATYSTYIKTVTCSTNANYYLTFVDSNNSSAGNESLYTNDKIFFNPNKCSLGLGNTINPSGTCSFAQGYSATASGAYSHASGYCVTASHSYEAAFGYYNVSNTSTIFSIGAGSSSSRFNLFEVVSDSGGNSAYGGYIKICGKNEGYGQIYVDGDGFNFSGSHTGNNAIYLSGDLTYCSSVLECGGDFIADHNAAINGHLDVNNGYDSSVILYHNTGYDATYIIEGGQRKVGFQLGSGGTNTGIWDYNHDIWLLYIDNSNNARFAGSCAAYGFNNISDIRIKNIIEQVSPLNIYDIANSPIFKFRYKNSLDGEVHVGTSAQYWQNILPNAVTVARDDIGTLSLQYDVAALASAISIAKKTVEQEQKINYLENQITQLRNEILNLKNTDSN